MPRRRTVLGLHYGPADEGIHDGGAALLHGGALVAISEERLSRRKYDAEFGGRAIGYCLDRFGISVNDLDLIVYDRFLVPDHRAYYLENLRRLFPRHNLDRIPLVGVNHHLLHACSAHFFSGAEENAVMVVDGAGERFTSEPGAPYETLSLYHARGRTIECIQKLKADVTVNRGIGLQWEDVSEAVGFTGRDSGKTMGLAPYGAPLAEAEPASSAVFFDDDPRLAERLEVRSLPIDSLRGTMTGGWGSPQVQRLAFLLQRETNDVLVSLATRLHRSLTNCPRLAMAGGVALNSVANYEILRRAPFEDVFIQPAASDTGIPLGAVAYGTRIYFGEDFDLSRFGYALGRPYSAGEIDEAAKACGGVRFRRSEDVALEVARLLADGGIVGWFQGGSEMGPRALGHRSILCSPAGRDTKDRLNERVKFREPFRPFAAAVLEESVSEYFEFSGKSPHMLLVAPVRPERRNEIPAVTHVDSSCRLQTVSPKNGVFYDLLTRFRTITGLPLVLNTSLNIKGDPIVETPAEALRVLVGSQMDALAIGDLLVMKER